MKSDYRIFKKTLDVIGIEYKAEDGFKQEKMILLKKQSLPMTRYLIFIFSKDGKFREVR